MQNNEKKMKRRDVIGRLFKYVKPYKGLYILALVLGFFAVATEMIGPMMLSNAIDDLTKGDIDLNGIWLNTALYIIVSVVISLILLLFERIILMHIGQKIVYRVREDIFIHTLSLSHKEFTSIPTGKMVTRITSDTLTLNELFTQTILNMVRDIITSILAMVIMALISIKLFLWVILFTPLLLIFTALFAHFSKVMYRKVRNDQTDMNTFLSESINGIRVIKAYSTENKERLKLKEKNDKVLKSNMLQMSVFAIFRPLIYSIYLISVLVVLYFGGIEAMEGTISAGVIVAFYTYISYYYDPIVDIAELLNTFEESLSSCEKIFISV